MFCDLDQHSDLGLLVGLLVLLGLLMLIIGIREKREAKRIRRDVAGMWRKEAEKQE